MKGNILKKAAIYARFSSDLQHERSIDDQVALCERTAQRAGYKVIKTYDDRAKSGTGTMDRDGLQALMAAAKLRKFDAIIVESLDRLSRDQADLSRLHKQLKFYKVALVTAHEGEATDISVGIRGIVGQMFIKDLADKVRRGHNGRVRAGLIPGKIAYGYRRVLGPEQADGRKDFLPGVREVDPDQAKIVRRIFKAYADGVSKREIAQALTDEGVPSPSGGKNWNHQCITGGAGNHLGIIGNQLYVGKIVWGTHQHVKDPDTERRIRRDGKPEDILIADAPHLRIVSDDLWEQAQGMRRKRGEQRGSRRGANTSTVREYVLAGLLTCSKCGHHMIVTRSKTARGAGPRVGCSAAFRKDACSHTKSYDLEAIEATVLHGLKTNLDVEALTAFTKGAHEEWSRRQKSAGAERDQVERTVNRVTMQIDRIVTAIADTDEPVEALVTKLKKLEAERAGLTEKLRLLRADGNVVSLHPQMIANFRASIEQMHEALTSASMTPEQSAPFRTAFRNTFERIEVHQTGWGKPYEVTPYARISAIMGVKLFPAMRTPEEMLKEQGLSSTLLEGTIALASQKQTIVRLGRWRNAA